jgi:hypothetical protein
MKKRGQITIFVILALVILLMVGLAIYYTSRAKETGFTRPNIDVDEKFTPVQNYVEQCMNQLLVDGIVKIGQHGGYVDPRDGYVTGKVLRLNPIAPYDSDVLFLSSVDINSSVAYWVHGIKSSDCDNCVLRSEAPTITEMEDQLSRYMQKYLPVCIDDYEVFNNQGFLALDSKNYSVKTSITDEGVAAILETDVYIKINNDEGKLNIFYTETDIPLKKYYDLALVITASEIDTNYLENMGLYLIDMHSGLDSTKLPPFSDMSTGYNVLFWSKFQVKENIKSLLYSYINVLRIPETKNSVDIPMDKLSPAEKYYYNSTRIDIFNGTNLSNIDISFAYTGQDIYLHLSPGDGELITPNTYVPEDFTSTFKGRTINKYNFFYQLAYPVLVEIREEYKPGVYYTFMFGMEASIVDNLKIRDYYDPNVRPIYWEEGAITRTINKPDFTGVNLAAYGFTGSTSNIDIVAAQKQLNDAIKPANVKSRYCDAVRRTSGNVRFKIYNSVTDQPVSGANVEFICGNVVKCDLGEVIYNSSLGASYFNQKLPVCTQGYLRISKEGYIAENILISTDTSTVQNLGSIYMDQIVTKEFKLQKYKIVKEEITGSDPVYSLNNISENISENNTVTISLERISYDKTDEPYRVSTVISKEYNSLDQTIRLAPGTYSLNIQMLDSEGVLIPKECKRVCVDGPSTVGAIFGDDCSEYDYIPKDTIEIKPAPWGGLDYSNRTLVHISPEDLNGDNIIVFSVLDLPKPSCFDDMQVADKIPSFSVLYKSTLMPKFVANTNTN